MNIILGGKDYLPESADIHFGGKFSTMLSCINITTEIDVLVEAPESFLIRLSSEDPAIVIVQKNAVVNIEDISCEFL